MTTGVGEPGGVSVATPPWHTRMLRVRGVAVYETPRARPNRGPGPCREGLRSRGSALRLQGRGAAAGDMTYLARARREMQQTPRRPAR